MTFPADYPDAEVLEAAQYGYSQPNHPRAWCLHTSEGFGTAQYFHLTTRQASTHYVIEQSGKVWQCVPESAGAYANAVEGKPYPAWADPHVNLNLQTLSVEIEGFASSIHQTMPRGSAQWNALVKLMAHRCKALGIPPENTIGHYQVSTSRSDPGALDIGQVVADVKAAMAAEEDDMALSEEALAQLEAYYGKAYTDPQGRPWPCKAAYDHVVLEALDAGTLGKLYDPTVAGSLAAQIAAQAGTPQAGGGLSLPLKIKGEITQ